VKDHKILSGTVAAAAVVGTVAVAMATRGRSTEIAAVAEEALAVSARESGTIAHSKLAGEAMNLLGASTLRRAAQVGIVPLALLGLAGCEKPETTVVYKDAASCEKGGVFTKAYCDSEFDAAKQTHDQTAPKFKAKDECEDTTGVACTADTPSSNSTQDNSMLWFRPYMYGYMMSQVMNSQNNNNYYRRSTPVYSTPGEGELVTSHGDDLGLKGPGTTKLYRDTIANASKPVSSGEEGETTKTATFSRSSSAITASRGSFGGEASESEGGAHTSSGGRSSAG
jgi:uncharacterized protein YgiB involved in biofilm formation